MYGVTGLGLLALPLLAAVPALLVAAVFVAPGAGPADALRGALVAVVPAALAFGFGYALLLLTAVRLLSLGLRTGTHPAHSRTGWQAWTVTQLMDLSRETLFPLYAGLITPVWLRLLGMRVGRGAEVSTVLALPSLTTVGDGAFLADDTLTAPFELGGGWLRIGRAEIGRRAFLGNSGMTAPGRSVPDGGLVGVLSATPKKAKKGSSYLGLPPVRLPRAAADADHSRTYEPPARLLWARGLVELCRLVPVFCSTALAVLTVLALSALARTLGPGAAALLSGAVLLTAGLTAALVAVLAKWLLVGRHRTGEHPLWSGFVWRNELADTFVEVLAVPWFAGAVPGTPLLTLWLRALGARIGRGVWCESHWLPETDLVTLGTGATVNAAPSSRPTSSTTGSCGRILWTSAKAPPWARTGSCCPAARSGPAPHWAPRPWSWPGNRCPPRPAGWATRSRRGGPDRRPATSTPGAVRASGTPPEHSAGSGHTSERPKAPGPRPVLPGER